MAIPGAKPGRAIGASDQNSRAEFQRRLDALDALTAELERRIARVEQLFARDFSTGK